MALTDFLTDIANAIRYAEGSVGTINAQQFATRIRALHGGQPVPKTLVSISATKTKVSYEVGETFSTDDVVVTAHYDDSTTANVTASATIGTVDTSTEGSKTLNISYTEDGVTETTTITITVSSVEPSEKIYWTALPLADIEPNTKLTISNDVLTIGHYTADDTTYYNKVSGTKLNGYIPLVAGTKVKLQSSGRTDGHTFVMTDDSLNVLYSSGTKTIVEETEVTVPQNATRLYYSEYLHQTFVIETQINDDGRLNEPTLAELNANYASSVALQGDKAIYNNLKPVFTFVLDDNIPSISETYGIFKTNGIKTCCACIDKNLRDVATTGNQCVKDVVDDMVANGGEVLAHHSGALTSETQGELSFEYNALTKQRLTDYGYDVETIILAGGEGQDTIDFELAEKWSRKYFKQSDKYGLVSPYNHPRIGFASSNSLATFKASFDSRVEEGGWYVYYMHGIDKETGVAPWLNDALEYVAEKLVNGDIEIKTYAEVYDSYYRSDPHIKGTGYIGEHEDLTWKFDSNTGLLSIKNNYEYGGIDIVSVSATQYHANDVTKILIEQPYPTRAIGMSAGVFSTYSNCTDFEITGYETNPRNSLLTNSYLPSSVTNIKVSWTQTQGGINPATVGASANATVTYADSPTPSGEIDLGTRHDNDTNPNKSKINAITVGESIVFSSDARYYYYQVENIESGKTYTVSRDSSLGNNFQIHMMFVDSNGVITQITPILNATSAQSQSLTATSSDATLYLRVRDEYKTAESYAGVTVTKS